METSLPLEGVRLIPTIGRLKLKTLTPLGGVSYSVTFTIAFPVVQFVVQVPPFFPLQEVSDRAPTTTKKFSLVFQFMQTPQENLDYRTLRGGWPGNPPGNTLTPEQALRYT